MDTPALAAVGHIEVLASAGVAEHRAAAGVVPAGGVGPHTLGVQPGSGWMLQCWLVIVHLQITA